MTNVNEGLKNTTNAKCCERRQMSNLWSAPLVASEIIYLSTPLILPNIYPLYNSC